MNRPRRIDWLCAFVWLVAAMIVLAVAYVAFSAIVSAAVWLALHAPSVLVGVVLAGVAWIWNTK